MASKERHKWWMSNKRGQQREQALIASGKCPKCECILALAVKPHDCTNYDWLILDE